MNEIPFTTLFLVFFMKHVFWVGTTFHFLRFKHLIWQKNQNQYPINNMFDIRSLSSYFSYFISEETKILNVHFEFFFTFNHPLTKVRRFEIRCSSVILWVVFHLLDKWNYLIYYIYEVITFIYYILFGCCFGNFICHAHCRLRTSNF